MEDHWLLLPWLPHIPALASLSAHAGAHNTFMHTWYLHTHKQRQMLIEKMKEGQGGT